MRKCMSRSQCKAERLIDSRRGAKVAKRSREEKRQEEHRNEGLDPQHINATRKEVWSQQIREHSTADTEVCSSHILFAKKSSDFDHQPFSPCRNDTPTPPALTDELWFRRICISWENKKVQQKGLKAKTLVMMTKQGVAKLVSGRLVCTGKHEGR